MSPPSLVRVVSQGGTTVLLGALLLVGVGTGGLLHQEAIYAQDRALLAAAHGHAGRAGAEPWELEHSQATVDVWSTGVNDEAVPGALRSRAVRSERPVYGDIDGRRVLVVMAEAESRSREREEEHRLVVASARKVRLTDSVGRFAVTYTVVAAIVALLSAMLLGDLARRAVAPLARAREASERVVRHGDDARLPVEGPAEVTALLTDLNALLDRLDRSFRAQTRFTGEAAHELRTPVTALLGELDIALRRPRSIAAYQDTLASMRIDVVRLRDLVNGLITLARLDSGQPLSERIPTRTGELVDAVLAVERRGLDAAGCTLRVDVRDDVEVEVQHSLLVAALSNLVRNAAKYAPETAVSLTVEARDGGLRFWVDDAGPGVPDDEREAVFDRFTRLGSARRSNPEGLGLGLALAREVARRHGGDCWVERSPAGGCRAILTIFQSAPQLG